MIRTVRAGAVEIGDLLEWPKPGNWVEVVDRKPGPVQLIKSQGRKIGVYLIVDTHAGDRQLHYWTHETVRTKPKETRA